MTHLADFLFWMDRRITRLSHACAAFCDEYEEATPLSYMIALFVLALQRIQQRIKKGERIMIYRILFGRWIL